MSEHYKPGERVPRSGQYQRVGKRGGAGPEVTGTKGERFPPTPERGQRYRLVDPTKNKSGRP
jgi:hypothetical protein